uniref:Uncharacterized protein n=1 Tax=Parascaris univalens TaxID=6257 RepID=A0A915BQB5_PARUN
MLHFTLMRKHPSILRTYTFGGFIMLDASYLLQRHAFICVEVFGTATFLALRLLPGRWRKKKLCAVEEGLFGCHFFQFSCFAGLLFLLLKILVFFFLTRYFAFTACNFFACQ